MIEYTEIFWTGISQTTTTGGTEWMVGCKCGCESEDECHGEGGCDVDEKEHGGRGV